MTNRPNQNLPQPVAAIGSKTPYAGALACLNRRWRIAPLPVGKKKSPPTGYLAAPLVSPAKLRQWEANRPGRNYAVVPGIDLTMLDVDPKHGGDASLFDLELEYGPLPPTFTVRTPSGGTHYYFRGLHRYKLNFRPGLDAPQYAVAPWSMWNGKRYEVIDSREPVSVPNWLPEVIGTPDESPDVEQISEVELDQADNIAWAIHHLRYDAARASKGRAASLLCCSRSVRSRITPYRSTRQSGMSTNGTTRSRVARRCGCAGDGPVEDRLDVQSRERMAIPGQDTARQCDRPKPNSRTPRG